MYLNKKTNLMQWYQKRPISNMKIRILSMLNKRDFNGMINYMCTLYPVFSYMCYMSYMCYVRFLLTLLLICESISEASAASLPHLQNG